MGTAQSLLLIGLLKLLLMGLGRIKLKADRFAPFSRRVSRLSAQMHDLIVVLLLLNLVEHDIQSYLIPLPALLTHQLGLVVVILLVG